MIFITGFPVWELRLNSKGNIQIWHKKFKINKKRRFCGRFLTYTTLLYKQSLGKGKTWKNKKNIDVQKMSHSICYNRGIKGKEEEI